MPDQPEQQQPTFPQMSVNVTPQGLAITTHFTPASAFTQVMDRETIKKVLPTLKDMIKQEQAQLQLIQHVRDTKNN